jgi:hypothetical protein
MGAGKDGLLAAASEYAVIGWSPICITGESVGDDSLSGVEVALLALAFRVPAGRAASSLSEMSK